MIDDDVIHLNSGEWYGNYYIDCHAINYEAYYSGNLPHIPKLTSSSHVHPFGIKNPKNHCLSMLFYKLFIVF